MLEYFGPGRVWLMLVLAVAVGALCFLSYPVVFPSPPCILQQPAAQECHAPDCTVSPQFPDPSAKLAELQNGNFTLELFGEAAYFEPLINASGTQVHMGFWSGAGNHGSLVRLLDGVNNYKPLGNQSAQKAIWDEGAQSSLQYPAYVRMNAIENWYARAYPSNGKVMVYGKEYDDPYPVAPAQADLIWGEYSERYAEMAQYIKNATGNPVQVWCFVQGAKANRIFYLYEYPALARLEGNGIVQVHFAKSQDADWLNPDDWVSGTENVTLPNN